MRITIRADVLAALVKAEQLSLFGGSVGGGGGSAGRGRGHLVPKRVTVPAHTRQDGTHIGQHSTTVYVRPDEPVAHAEAPVRDLHAEREAETLREIHAHLVQHAQSVGLTGAEARAGAEHLSEANAKLGFLEAGPRFTRHMTDNRLPDAAHVGDWGYSPHNRADPKATANAAMASIVAKLNATREPHEQLASPVPALTPPPPHEQDMDAWLADVLGTSSAPSEPPTPQETPPAPRADTAPTPGTLDHALTNREPGYYSITVRRSAIPRGMNRPRVSWHGVPGGETTDPSEVRARVAQLHGEQVSVSFISNKDDARNGTPATIWSGSIAAQRPAIPATPGPGDLVHRYLATSDGRHVRVRGAVRAMPSGALRVYVDHADPGTPQAHAADSSHAMDESWVNVSTEPTRPPLPATLGASENLRDALGTIERAGAPTGGLTTLRHVMDMFERGGYDLPQAERTAVYGIVHAVETGRLDGATSTAIERMRPEVLALLISSASREATTIGDVPRWLASNHADIKALATPALAADSDMLRRVKNAAPRDPDVRRHFLDYKSATAEAARHRARGAHERAALADVRATRSLTLAHDLIPDKAVDAALAAIGAPLRK